MAKKLMSLCELQLYSILQEIDSSTAVTTMAATQAMEYCDRLADTLAEYEQRDAGEETLGALRRELSNVVVSLQFHDELAQRVNHVLQLLELLRNETPELQDCSRHCDDELVKIVSRIFSVQSEFAVLHKVFPDYRSSAADAEPELF